MVQVHSSRCSQPFVNVSEKSSEPWQVPAFYGRALYPTEYRRPTSCGLHSAVRVESHLTIATAKSTRNPKGGTEATLGNYTPTPWDFVHKKIVQPHDNRLERVYPNMDRTTNRVTFSS